RFADGTTLPVSGVFVALGTAGSDAFARTMGAVLEDGRLRVDADQQTSLPGLFAAGDCCGGLLQVAKAVHEGAVAGLAAVRYLRDREG
ncbi:MAG: NAD(P)/FAD-dependent oxidoreductase, partial [Schwartzia sp.]|nr:NAD(P)/FAD-dependent oxidoreductase [Schwartzia sp. (in: firmicutes)]